MTRPVPPFYENWDDTHCAPCVLRGVLEHFEPDTAWTWEQLDALMGKEPGKWTWPQRGWIAMLERGYDVTVINTSDYKRYLEVGLYESMVERLGKEAADKSRRMSDLDKARVDVERFLAYPDVHQCRTPTLDDIKRLLEKGYLIGATLNLPVLDGKEGFGNHSVLVYDMDDTHIVMHDSGLPARPERRVTYDVYVKASTSPTYHNWSIAAYKLEK